MKAVRVVFMGSAPIAVPALEAVAARFDAVLAVTQPDRPKGRGRKSAATAVREAADRLGIRVLATADVNAQECAEAIAGSKPDVVAVVSFGQILKKRILELPGMGCLNAHFSLLPELRGAAPVPWAIIRGCRTTGVSIIKMAARMDGGPVYAQVGEPVREDDTAGTLSARLAPTGARLLADVLERLAAGGIAPAEQQESLATYAPKITRRDAAIDWGRAAREIDRLIRGLSGQLEAYGFLRRQPPVRVTFHNSTFVDGDTPGAGIAARGRPGDLMIGCGSGMIEARELQAEGRRRVSGREFANGYHIVAGERFDNG